ncbi:MAG: hypothetical protein ACQEXJ_11125 [Myxococcota bacterium]
MRRAWITAALTMGIALAWAAPSRADNNGPITLGLGTGLGVHRTAQPNAAPDSQIVSNMNLRLKMLWFLGVDLTWSYMPAQQPDDELQFGAELRATGLVYPIPTDVVGVYLGAGIGAGNFGDLVSVTAPSNSYHVGGGLEVHVTDHITLDGSFFMIIPGYASIERDVTRRALSTYENARDEIRTQQDLERVHDLAGDAVEVRDYISPKNFEVLLRGMFYF